jgi:intracellular sulfur oxidation DsrE/DsrF family protein
MRLERQTRRSFAAALWAVSAWTLGTRTVSAQARAPRFQPTRHAQDAWLDALPGKHRTIIDGSTVAGAGTALLYAYNLYAANMSEYSLPERDVAVVVCLRHSGTAFGFNDAMWGKYGKSMNAAVQLADPNTKDTPKTNLFYSVDYGFALTNLGVTIESLVKQGTRFAICAMATRGLAGSIAAETGTDAETVYKELVANTIPNSRMVAAGVLAVTRAQEYGYALVTPV